MDTSNQSLTETNARSLMQIAEGYRLTENTQECPSVDQLKSQRLISRGSKNLDAWGQAFKIECQDDEVVVVSAGKDKAFGTPDDTRVPPV